MRRTLLVQPVKHIHRLSSSRAFVQQRRIGQLHTGKVDHHGLVVQKGFQTTLADLCLIGRVLGIPSWVFHDVTQNHTWGVGIVIAHPDEILIGFVFRCFFTQHRQKFNFTHRRIHIQWIFQADVLRNYLINQIIQALGTNGSKHGIQITLSWSDVAIGKRLRIKGVELIHKYANLMFPHRN